jgi:hypothetical protein
VPILEVANPLSGLSWKTPVRVATAADLPANTPSGSGRGKTLTANASGALVVNGRNVAVADRILVKDYAGTGSSVHNGIYTVVQTGSGSTPWILVRALDFDGVGPTTSVISGAVAVANDGDTAPGAGWRLATLDPVVIDTTALRFVDFGDASGGSSSTTNAGIVILTGTVIPDSAVPVTAYLTGGGFASASPRRFPVSARQATGMRAVLLSNSLGVDAGITLLHNNSPTAEAVTAPHTDGSGAKYASSAAVTFIDGDDFDVAVTVPPDASGGSAEISVGIQFGPATGDPGSTDAPAVFTVTSAYDAIVATTAYLTSGGFAAATPRRYPASGRRFAKLTVHVLANTSGVNSVFTVMKSGVATGLTYTVPAGTTGVFTVSATVNYGSTDDFDVVLTAASDATVNSGIDASVSVEG